MSQKVEATERHQPGQEYGLGEVLWGGVKAAATGFAEPIGAVVGALAESDLFNHGRTEIAAMLFSPGHSGFVMYQHQTAAENFYGQSVQTAEPMQTATQVEAPAVEPVQGLYEPGPVHGLPAEPPHQGRGGMSY